MNLKSLNDGYAPEAPIHRLEKAGLGLAPFRCVGYQKLVYVACQGAPVKPGGTCDYCGQAIMHAFYILSKDGKRFKVGCDCVARVGDEGLLRACKNSPEYRKAVREREALKATTIYKELEILIAALEPKLRARPHPLGYVDRKTGEPLTHFDQVDWLFANSGRSGRKSLLTSLRKLEQTLSGNVPEQPTTHNETTTAQS